MKSSDNNIVYTAKDIEQYLAGNLSPKQMHAMEKAALDDPFLSEAMEGFEAMKEKSWTNDLVALRKELSQKTETAKVIPLHQSKTNWWKTAAAIFIVGSGVALTWVLTRDEPDAESNPQIAQISSQDTAGLTKVESESTVSTTISLNPTASATKEELLVQNNTSSKKQNELDNTTEPLAAFNETKTIPGQSDLATVSEDRKAPVLAPSPAKAAAPGKINIPVMEDAGNVTGKDVAMEAEVLRSQKTQAGNTVKKEATPNNYFTAQVVAPDNSPLPFTNISIKKENFGTYADSKGMVRLVSTDSILYVDVKSVGYQPKTFALRNNQTQTKIILQEDGVALKEQVVVGNADMSKTRLSRRATLISDSAVSVEPADGWENYNTYVANNLDIPESSLKRDFHGEVELSFDVKPNGTISNLRVNKSLGAEFDEAAKRLIMEGPQWKVKKGKKTSANVKLQF